jgi:hypothetical protein
MAKLHTATASHRKGWSQMKKRLAFVIATTLSVAGCATTKEWVATGGSRADGVVKLSYQYGLFERPQLSAQQALELAKSRCTAWGYSGAEPFGGIARACNNYGSYGCISWLVTANFQCLGNLEK